MVIRLSFNYGSIHVVTITNYSLLTIESGRKWSTMKETLPFSEVLYYQI